MKMQKRGREIHIRAKLLQKDLMPSSYYLRLSGFGDFSFFFLIEITLFAPGVKRKVGGLTVEQVSFFIMNEDLL